MMSLCYTAMALIIYTWLGGESNASNSFYITFVNIYCFYIQKEDKAFISHYEQYRIYNDSIAPIQLISTILLLMSIFIIATSVSMFCEGSRMNALFTQSIKLHETKTRFPISKWLLIGIQNNIAAIWGQRQRAHKYVV
jgi:hypothetical protein